MSGAPSTKADYWIPVRPATDAALWLGVTRLMMDNKWYDEAFVKRFTDFPTAGSPDANGLMYNQPGVWMMQGYVKAK